MASARRFALRDGTAAAHRALEDLVGPLDSEAGYRRYVNGLYAGRAPVEAALAAADWPAEFGDWRPVMLAPLLRQDAADLGDAAPPPTDAYVIADGASGLLGVLYVLEGSALGAQLLVKQARAMGLSEAFGARHLSVQAGTMTSWTRFLSVLDAADGFDEERAVASANTVFGFLRRAMTG